MLAKLRSALFAFCIVTAAGVGVALSADGITFGDKPTFQSDSKFGYALSPDKKAFTITFEGLEVQVDGGKLPDKIAKRKRSPAKTGPVATRVFSLALPMKSGKAVRVPLFVSGLVVTTSNAGATLLFSVNGQQTVTSFGPNADKSFIQRLNFRAPATSELRMTVFLLAERQGTDPAAFLSVNAIDTDVAQIKKRATPKK